ncbi:MAG TPA: Z1 domain-containing protein [Burkholderiales bacterium]|nr:Z1 domain-containing protein [Burkholderiales bacterium]
MDAYEADVAAGEVGATGSGRAVNAPPIARCPTILLYGRVQSGKTAGMIATTAMALDNGVRVVIVLTANNVTLAKQTANRFKSLSGPSVFSALKEDEDYEWTGRVDELRDDLQQSGVVIVAPKDSRHLRAVIQLLQDLGAADYPALIFDDEADAATPDTTLAARASGRANAPQYASTINRRVVENTDPEEAGESIRERLPHNIYVQVTATPFVLLLQGSESPLRPTLTHLLEPGTGYCGGDIFFGAFDPDAAESPAPPLVMVPDTEAQSLLAARRGPPPIGIVNSVAFFLLSGASLAALTGVGRFPPHGYKHLSHTSVLQDQHDLVHGLLAHHLHTLRQTLRDVRSPEARAAFQDAYLELQRTERDIARIGGRMLALDELLPIVAQGLEQAEVIKVNANTGEPEYGPTFNFVVGGNILGRGVTIDDLLVTYYIREAQISQMDTVWQHGRMFGYREELMPFTRVYLRRRLATRFKGITESERDLREIAEAAARGEPVPISVVAGTRATRPNALDSTAIRVYRPGSQIYPRLLVSDPAQVGSTNEQIRALLVSANAPLDEGDRRRRFQRAPLNVLKSIADIVPISEGDSGTWDTDAVSAILDVLSERYGGHGYLYVRAFEEDPPSRFPHGALSGPEVELARGQNAPVLALIYRGESSRPHYWYPTLCLPPGAPVQIFNAA